MPVNSALQDTTLVESDLTPAPKQLQPPATMPRWIPVVGVLAIVVGTFLAWPTRQDDQTPTFAEVEMRHTWRESLFSASSTDGWRSSGGLELTIETDPVEQATALSLNATRIPTGWATRRLPIPADSDPWFEVESQILLGSSSAGGVLFGLTDAEAEYRLRITSDAASLLNDSTNETLGTRAVLPPTAENPVSVRLRLQPTGWRIFVNGSQIGTAPVREGTQATIQLFTEEGQTFFTDINVTGLEVVTVAPEASIIPVE